MNWSAIATAAYAVSWLIVIGALFMVPRNRKPSSATAWLLLIVLLPYVGAGLFLLIGSPKLSRWRRAQQRTMDRALADRLVAALHRPELVKLFDPAVPARVEPFVRLNAALGGMPACAGNTLELIADYGEAICRMTEAVEHATSFVHVQFYILAMDGTTEPFLAALERAVARGVKVRLLLDHLGSRKYPGRERMTERLTAAGVEWRFTLPVRPFHGHWNRPDLRNHRKLLVVDGRIGFAGSINMIDRTYLVPRNLRRGIAYVDLVVRASGPVVAELDAVFQTDWYSETGVLLDATTAPETVVLPEATGDTLCQVLPSGPGYENDNNLKLFTALIHAARRRLVVTSPYFVPDDSLMTAITSAAQRGVEVTLFSSDVADQFLVYHAQRSYYEALLAAGVEILLLRSPALLHAKHVSIDDDIAVIGSSNLDMRSLTLNLEITLLVFDEATVRELRRIEADYRERSTPVAADAWAARSLPRKLADNLARLTAALQ